MNFTMKSSLIGNENNFIISGFAFKYSIQEIIMKKLQVYLRPYFSVCVSICRSNFIPVIWLLILLIIYKSSVFGRNIWVDLPWRCPKQPLVWFQIDFRVPNIKKEKLGNSKKYSQKIFLYLVRVAHSQIQAQTLWLH